MTRRVPRILFAAAVAWCALIEIAEFVAGRLFGMELDGDWFLLVTGSSAEEMLQFVRVYSGPLALAFAAFASVSAAAFWAAFRASRRVFLAAVALAAAFAAVRVVQVRSVRAWKPLYLAFDTVRGAREYWRVGKAGRWTDELAALVRAAPPGATNYVIVIGESLTSHRVPFYGYGKPTMPCLSALGDSLAVRGPVRATSPYTVRALIDLLVSGGRAAPVWFRLAGYRTGFVGAHERWGRYCSVEASLFAACERRVYLSDVCGGGRVYDAQVLPYAREMMEGDGPFALFVHLIGSHFEPGTRVPDGFASGEGLDDYDRSVRYEDRVLADLMASLPPRTVLLFISDHGESVDAGRWRDVSSEALWSVPVFVYPSGAAPEIGSVADFVAVWRAWASHGG